MASMVKKFRLAWISVCWPQMEGKRYFSKCMNPYAHTRVHVPGLQSCNRICSCAASCPSGAALKAHLTAWAAVTSRFGDAAANASQENSRVLQSKPGNGHRQGKVNTELVTLVNDDAGALCTSTFRPMGENATCAPHHKAGVGEGSLELILVLIQARMQLLHHGTTVLKSTCCHASPAPWVSPSVCLRSWCCCGLLGLAVWDPTCSSLPLGTDQGK